MKHNNPLTSIKAIQFIALLLLLQWPILSKGQTWNNASTNNLWYDAANWTPNTGPGGWNTTSTATFIDAGTRTVGIDFSQGNLALNKISTGITNVGSPMLTIGNSSATPGILQLGGASNNIVNAFYCNLVIQNNVMGGTGGMSVALANSNNVLTSSFGSITVDAPITGIGKSVNIGDGNGTAVVEFKGQNTYTGLTTIVGGAGSNSASLTLNRPGGGTLPSTNDITVDLKGTLKVLTDQTLNNLYVRSSSPAAFLQIGNNVTFNNHR